MCFAHGRSRFPILSEGAECSEYFRQRSSRRISEGEEIEAERSRKAYGDSRLVERHERLMTGPTFASGALSVVIRRQLAPP